MDDWCTCLCVDGATLEQRKVIVALKSQLAEARELLKEIPHSTHPLYNRIIDFLKEPK
jgi:hypothetical protein